MRRLADLVAARRLPARGPARLAGYLVVGWRLRGLAATPAARRRVLLAAALLPFAAPSRPFVLELERDGHAFRYLPRDASELDVLYAVFVQEEYAAGAPPRADTIVDLGANAGATVHWWRARHPDARILAVEPDPATFARLRRSAGAEPGVELRNVAVAGEDGSRTLARTGESWGSRLASGPVAGGVEVPARTLDALLAEHAVDTVDILKVDIEGAEHEVLARFAGLDRVGTLLMEHHPDLCGHAIEELEPALAGFAVVDVERKGGLGRSWVRARRATA